MILDSRSLKSLKGVHPDLVAMMHEAAKETPVAFRITEGLRTRERQLALVKAGASKTLESRHLTGHAVDVVCLVNEEVRWDWPLYDKLAKHIKPVAARLGTRIVWGGDWTTLRDGPHYELDKRFYPVEKKP